MCWIGNGYPAETRRRHQLIQIFAAAGDQAKRHRALKAIDHQEHLGLIYSTSNISLIESGFDIFSKFLSVASADSIFISHSTYTFYHHQGKKLKQHILKIADRSQHIKEVRGMELFIGIEVKYGDAIKQGDGHTF